MADLEEILAQGAKDGKIPHAVVYATNKDGSFTYKHAVGKKNYPEEDAISDDALFQLASQTKLLTSIAALQIVEKGLFTLDRDAAEILPELAEQPIITGFDTDDKPILENRKNAITLRHLLTHSSGAVYDAGDPLLIKLQAQRGKSTNTGTTVVGKFTYPLVFEPGTSWCYGTSTDWAGKLIERITGETLEDYFKTNIFTPLGMKGVTFWPNKDPELKDKVPQLTVRTPDGQLGPMTGPWLNTGSEDCFGGHGGYAQLGEYIKVQRSILANDGKILKPESVELMFTPQLSPEVAKALKNVLASPLGALFIGEMKPTIDVNWGLGGILFLDGDDGRRKKGTLCWGGAANCFWTIDREANLALTFGTQVVPPGDGLTETMITATELEVYKKAGVKF